MKLIGVHVEPVHHALRDSIRAAAWGLEARQGFALGLRDESGTVGSGEALPIPAATEDLSATAQAISDVVPLCAQNAYGLSGLLDVLGDVLPDAPATRCAFDAAAHALEARLRQTCVASLLCERPLETVKVCALLGAVTKEEIEQQVAVALRRGYRTLALRVGLLHPNEDVARVAALRELAGPELRIRLDAQGAWAPGRALEMLERLADLDVELIAQPVHAPDLDAMCWLHGRSPVPIAAGASLAVPGARELLLGGELAAVAQLEPTRLAGLRPCLRLGRRAAAEGIPSYVWAPLDAAKGTAAALQLAAALPEGGLDHGLAGADCFEEPFPPDLQPKEGVLQVSCGTQAD